MDILFWFEENFKELVDLMANSSHHRDAEHLSQFHLEGSVWVHSCLVYQQASQSKSARTNVLQLLALTHDIGKPNTREVDGIKVRFRNHEADSVRLSLPILDKAIEDGIIFESDRFDILSVISLHTPAHRWSEYKPKASTSDKAVVKLLTEFTNCDNFGRICNDESRRKTKIKVEISDAKKQLTDMYVDVVYTQGNLIEISGGSEFIMIDRYEDKQTINTTISNAIGQAFRNKAETINIRYSRNLSLRERRFIVSCVRGRANINITVYPSTFNANNPTSMPIHGEGFRSITIAKNKKK